MKKANPLLLTLISGFAVYIFDKIWGQNIAWNKVSKIHFLDVLLVQIKIYQVFLFVAFLSIFYLIKKYIQSRGDGNFYYTKRQKKLRLINQMEVGNLIWKWDIFFNINKKPYVHNLTPYCPKHGEIPIKMEIGYRGVTSGYFCAYESCNSYVSNRMMQDDFKKIKQIIESNIENEWLKINK